MITTYGAMPTSMPAGFLTAVRFPVLMLLDQKTPDRRLFDSLGATTRSLPAPIRAAFTTSYGHDGAENTGALFEVTVNPEAGLVSGRGFLANDEPGRRHARAIQMEMMRGNSADLADVKARFEEELDGSDYWVRFYEFAIAMTTGVGIPAFAEAFAEIDPLSDEELVASLGDPMDELVASFDVEAWTREGSWTNLILPPVVEPEMAASAIVLAHASYFKPEAPRPTKITVDANEEVSGHLGLWKTCHDGIDGRCAMIPRPSDGYASFNKPGVLTDRGIVETGPIFAYGGHHRSNGAAELGDAYGGIENTWCDVRITEGIFGPWLSGRVRPGTKPETVVAARASRISGHWIGDRLKAIVSVNAEGFDVPGSGLEADLQAGFAFSINDTGVCELIASFPDCMDDTTDTVAIDADGKVIAAGATNVPEQVTEVLQAAADAVADDGGSVTVLQIEADRLRLMLALD